MQLRDVQGRRAADLFHALPRLVDEHADAPDTGARHDLRRPLRARYSADSSDRS